MDVQQHILRLQIPGTVCEDKKQIHLSTR
jgi:hypothetical protein